MMATTSTRPCACALAVLAAGGTAGGSDGCDDVAGSFAAKAHAVRQCLEWAVQAGADLSKVDVRCSPADGTQRPALWPAVLFTSVPVQDATVCVAASCSSMESAPAIKSW